MKEDLQRDLREVIQHVESAQRAQDTNRADFALSSLRLAGEILERVRAALIGMRAVGQAPNANASGLYREDER